MSSLTQVVGFQLQLLLFVWCVLKIFLMYVTSYVLNANIKYKSIRLLLEHSIKSPAFIACYVVEYVLIFGVYVNFITCATLSVERVFATATCPPVCLSVTAGIVSKRKQLAS